MKAATVEESLDQQAEILAWAKAGEEVAISHGGIVIARLVPERRPAYFRDRSGERVLSAAEVTPILDGNKGPW